MALNNTSPSVLLENVVSLIHSKVTGPQALTLEKFATAIYQLMPSDDLQQRSDSDLYGAALSLWNRLNQTPSKASTIRVYNPELSKDGWHSSHTIIEIIQPDMPFLVDSIGMALNRMGLTAHMMLNKPISVVRDEQGFVTDISSVNHGENSENVATFSIEIDRLSSVDDIAALEKELGAVLFDVQSAVDDWKPMSEKMSEVITQVETEPQPCSEAAKAESVGFLKYLQNHHFTLLGYRHYSLNKVEGDLVLQPNIETSLGLLKRADQYEHGSVSLSEFSGEARKEALSPNILILTKSNSKSRVHRNAYVDYIGVKEFDQQGNVIGEHRFLGLYSSSLYNSSPRVIPLLNSKLERIMAQSGLTPYSHDYKALLNILETYPRDELIQATETELAQISRGILKMQDRDRVKSFIRKDVFNRYFSVMVYVSKDRYNTKLREVTQRLLADYFDAETEVEFNTFFSESPLARTHYIVKVEENNNKEYDVTHIEQNLIEAARSWEDKLETALFNQFGEEKAKALSDRFAAAFPRSYKEDMLPNAALVDIEQLEALDDEHQLGMLFFQPQEAVLADKQVRLKLFQKDEPIHLSDVLPMLENFGLRVIGERPYRINSSDGQTFWILDFSMSVKGNVENIMDNQQNFQQALTQVWQQILEDDGFNRLVLAASLSGREVSIVRAYAKYMRQIDATFSQAYIEETFTNYPHFAKLLVKMFETKFDPVVKTRALDKLIAQVESALDDVSSLDDDRIIRRYLDLIQATLRTNFYQNDDSGNNKQYISFKFSPELIPEMPLPLPKFEIFVYSTRIEGVHLRGGKVARGGLRWSDRREDFRTEVLGLVKAQQVKNTVIVPVGAKGGFVCKQLPTTGGRDAFFAEGQECYKMFIRGLLDISDNIIAGEVVPPIDVVRHDDDDPYLVVAADKGTATFSDIANAISEEYNFWLGDAFASGGSNGYDHKKMGITAKGAWESVKRHFREIGVDCQSTDFTTIAVGDMAGDVFGNGMLLSKHIRLQAAFNHMHIFIDPNPDSASSYEERKRLFELPRSSWEDYNKELISQGGGIFNRSAKSIKLTAEIQAMLGTKKQTMAPNELLKAILMMKVDLIWNGGIGTYVKATTESHADVGDRANDAIRINGNEVRAKIIGEGGNLGCTQLGRIEFAANGGRVNTDFTDNVGGVDCSDNEVNIKILLNTLVANGDLTVKQRNVLLEDMTEEVSGIVLDDCNQQSRAISVTQLNGASELKEHTRFIQHLEREGQLDRELEFLPSDDELAERQAEDGSLTRPELCVLFAYAKMVLKEELLIDDIVQNSYFDSHLINYFPERLQQSYQAEMADHPLRGEIIATSLANAMVNDMGLSFCQRMQEETGASPADVAIAYAIAREVFGVESIVDEVIALNGDVDTDVQYEMLTQMRLTVRRATRWLLRRRNRNWSIEKSIAFFKPVFETLEQNFDQLMIEEELVDLNTVVEQYVTSGVPAATARKMSHLSTLFSSLDIAQIAKQAERDVLLVAETYYKLGAKIELHWFLEQINAQHVSNHWQALARAALREDLDWQQRSLTLVVLRNCTSACAADDVISAWLSDCELLMKRWFQMLADFKTSGNDEFAKFSVTLRELNLLIQQCEDNV
ncbi:NAD-glutamate dehydrogenase [Paraferrimonas sp. SM1919]|uniref:NAD-glutamate dehydrogenase n=1 Tax=Paraferrimonas sp. SM1919 TaxID=2662263 RepID=UPI0013D54511|nr:NAD-glutamate dehydrogenase [Paraferrimonas sp. SM1919]